MFSVVLYLLVLAKAPTATPVGPGAYPRGTQLPSGEVLVCSGMDIYRQPTPAEQQQQQQQPLRSPAWVHVGTVRPPEGPGIDLGNCVLTWDNATSTLLASYRHHAGCKNPDDANGAGGREAGPIISELNRTTSRPRVDAWVCDWFSIQVSWSTDGGGSWSLLSTVVNSTVGMWEPFFFTAQDKLWIA